MAHPVPAFYTLCHNIYIYINRQKARRASSRCALSFAKELRNMHARKRAYPTIQSILHIAYNMLNTTKAEKRNLNVGAMVSCVCQSIIAQPCSRSSAPTATGKPSAA